MKGLKKSQKIDWIFPKNPTTFSSIPDTNKALLNLELPFKTDSVSLMEACEKTFPPKVGWNLKETRRDWIIHLVKAEKFAIMFPKIGVHMTKYIHTLGDSILDNLYWMLLSSDKNTAKNNSVEGKLKAKGHYVVSHAFDGFTTNSVLGQDYIGAVLPPGPAKQAYMKEKAGKAAVVSPLKELQEKISERPNSTHYVAISVGGNDFRVNLHNPWRLIKDISQIQSRYLQILEKVKSLQGHDIKPLLIFQYRTDANQDPYLIYTVLGILGSIAVATHLACFACLTAPIWVCAGQISIFTGGMFALAGAIGLYGSKKIVPLSVTKNVLLGGKISVSMIGGMLESFYQPILNQAKKDRIPILDLPNTFNPFEKLYECGIEPNAKGGALIADGIHHVVTCHDFSGESVLYSKPKDKSEYVRMENLKPSNWRVAYPSKP